MSDISKDCSTCSQAILCPTWGEYRCLSKKMWIRDPAAWAACEDYVKGTASEKCHCPTCEGYEDEAL